jgi:dGTPase
MIPAPFTLDKLSHKGNRLIVCFQRRRRGTPLVKGTIDRWRAPYAADPRISRGRAVAEPASATRSDFQRDRDRIIHSTAFRRLKHKTQVFVEHEGDHYRTRLTHTIEVAQIARALARALGLDEDLAEGLALAHDLGHTPFGHAGERALDRVMRHAGGFDHNAQTLRVVTRLERRYANFDGLNLTWEMLEGIVKHNGPVVDREGRPTPRFLEHGIAGAIRECDLERKLDLWSYASAEAQAAALADDIAYDAHDIDDGLRARLFSVDDLREVPFLAELIADIDAAYPGLEAVRRNHELVRRVITRFIEDVIVESERRLAALPDQTVAAVREAQQESVSLSERMAAADRDIKRFLHRRMYRQARVQRIMQDAEQIVEDLFTRHVEDFSLMPEEWRADTRALNEQRSARRIADYIAGMTDRYAIDLHRRLFDHTPDLK